MDKTPNKIEEKEEKPSLLKKIIIRGFTVLVIIMVLLYFTTNPLIRSLIVGLFESSTIERDGIDIGKGNKLFFVNNSYEKLTEIYDANPEKEFKVCLKGKIADGNYFINEIYEPEMSFQRYNVVIAEPCPADSLVSMHSHPYRHCLPSQQDLQNFNDFKQKNPNALMAVMCEKGRFNFYR